MSLGPYDRDAPLEKREGRPPILFVVDDDPEALERVAGELERRYGMDYRIHRESSAPGALEALGRLRQGGEKVALLLVAVWTEGLSGEELLDRSRALYPGARRGLLIDWGGWSDRATAEAIFRTMARGHMDYYVLRPWRSPDEYFHRTVTEFLNEWSRAEEATPREATLVAERWSPRGYELRNLLTRNGVPHVYHEAESEEGLLLLDTLNRGPEDGPVVFTVDGKVLVDPTNAELARAYGVDTELDQERDFDLVVVGAGPAGLSAAVYGASEGLRTLVVESEAIGGQAGSSSRIRNYLGFSRGVSGSELAQRAYQQAWVFGARFLLMRQVTGLRTEEGGRHRLTISDGSEVTAGAVILATGVTYRRIGIPDLERFSGAGVFYGASVSESRGVAGEDVFVVGGGNSAGQAALHLARHAGRVTLLVRGPSLTETMSRYLVDELDAAENVDVLLETEVVGGGGGHRLEHLRIRDASGGIRSIPAFAVFVMIGARPHTGWLPAEIRRDRWGYVVTGEDLTEHASGEESPPGASVRRAAMFETSVPGVFAVGDVRSQSIKRVASAVGEGSVAISRVHRHLSDLEKRTDAKARVGARPETSGRT